jgi:hypothetical protein
MAVAVLSDVLVVDERLSGLGLSSDALHEAFRRADADRRECTPFDPVSLPGMIFWGRVVRYLREQYVGRHGWHSADPGQVPLLVNPDRSFAIAASSGSPETGIAALSPSTRYAKGTAVVQRVQLNEQLMIDGFEPPGDVEDPSMFPTWFLLYRHARQGEGVRLYSELSLPTGASDGHRIDTWHERIILPHLDFEALAPLTEDLDALDEIDIPVTRLG